MDIGHSDVFDVCLKEVLGNAVVVGKKSLRVLQEVAVDQVRLEPASLGRGKVRCSASSHRPEMANQDLFQTWRLQLE